MIPPKLGACAPKVLKNQPSLSLLRTLFVAPPPSRVIRPSDPKPQMLGNDTIGNCTSVGIANSIRAIASLSGFQVKVSTEDAVGFYSKSAGYIPGNPASDKGAVESEVLAYAAQNGYATQNETFYPIWGDLPDPFDRNALANVVSRFGVAYIGVMLAEADQLAASDSTLVLGDCNVPGYYNYDPTPGSWGGHCLLVWGYTGLGDNDTVYLLTWGKVFKATWAWIHSRIMEAHALAFRQLQRYDYSYLGAKDWNLFLEANTAFLKTYY